MQIYVNEQVLDAELTGQENLAEVYEAISKWSNDNKKYIINLKIDEVDVSISRLDEFASEVVERLDFYIGDEMDMVLSTLNETDRYLDQIGGALFEQQELSGNDVTNLRDGATWMRSIMASVASLMHLDLDKTHSALVGPGDGDITIQSVLGDLESQAGNFKDGDGRDKIEDFLESLRAFKLFISALLSQLESLAAGQEELLESVEEFEAVMPALNADIISINECFNGGKDNEALLKLEVITVKLNEYIAALFALEHQLRVNNNESLSQLTVNDVSFEEVSRNLTRLLKDLSASLEENDIVAAGDILEYELTECLSSLKPFLPQIKVLVLSADNTGG